MKITAKLVQIPKEERFPCDNTIVSSSFVETEFFPPDNESAESHLVRIKNKFDAVHLNEGYRSFCKNYHQKLVVEITH